MPPESSRIFEFADFRLDPSEKTLLRRGGAPVPLTPKAFDTLAVLVENAGRLLEKNELMRLIWQDSFVEEGNLAFNIKVLRKALGDNAASPRFIETVPKRGYRFIARVTPIEPEQQPHAAQNPALPGSNVTAGKFPRRAGDAETSPAGAVVALADWRRRHDESAADDAGFAPDARAENSAGLAPVQPKPASRAAFLTIGLLGLVFLAAIIYGLVYFFTPKNSGGITRTANPVRLTSNGNTKLAAVSPDGKFVAYVIDKDRQQSLWLKNIATESDLLILPAAENTSLASVFFSPTGDNVFYAANGSLFQISILGGTPKKVLPQPSSGFTISPDGKQFAFIRYGNDGGETAELVAVDSDGRNERVLASSRRPEIFLRSPAFSPDGRRIACAALSADGAQKVAVVEVADGTVSMLPSPAWESVSQVLWQPHTSALLVLAANEENIYYTQIWSLGFPQGEARNISSDSNNYRSLSLTADGKSLIAVRAEQTAHLWVMPGEDPNQARQITEGFEKFDGIYALDWLPDGRILYETAPNGRSVVWRVRSDGQGAEQITTGAFSTDAAPDGKFIVFRGKDENGEGLFRLNMNDGEKKRLTTGIDIWASVSPDSKWVVFTRYADEVAVWKVPADGGEAVRLTAESGYPVAPTVSPDGKFVAFHMTKSGSKTPPQIAIVPVEGGEIIKTFELPVQYADNYDRDALQWTPDSLAINYNVIANDVSNIWRQPIAGGAPVRVTDFKELRIFNFAFSPDGKQLALSRGKINRDVFLIKNEVP